MNKHSLHIFILLTLISIFLAACSSGDGEGQTASSDKPIQVVTTIGMIADIAEQVGGDRVEVTGLMGPGVDPHLFKASEGDVGRMSEADIIFYNGLHLEAKMADIFEQMAGTKTTAAVAEVISPEKLLSPPEFQGSYDPHVWFDVALWMEAVEEVKDTLAVFDGDNAQLYEDNAAAYLEELEALHAYVQEQADRVPADKRVLITAHDAFNYFGQAYGFEVRGLQGISTAAEAGTADVQELADFIVERQIPAVFVESSVSPRFIEAVQATVASQGFKTEIGGQLFSDAMGNAGTPEGTYMGMVRHNIDTIVEALLADGAL